jgi:mono/diheme cytochrome c family protein
MKPRLIPVGIALCMTTLHATDPQIAERGKQAEEQSCVECHSLRLVNSQRLSATAWGKEVDKMIGWGAVVPNRQLLVDYLSQQFSDTKAVPQPALSGNGSKKTARSPSK